MDMGCSSERVNGSHGTKNCASEYRVGTPESVFSHAHVKSDKTPSTRRPISAWAGALDKMEI
jgi:hypothetical protein